ncbi:MAG TPA: SdrD B-like domain-containing protein, partial [Saprospiraceae bacterium]|nr:SdrD B-like domain-containing protein [Saprospiraceae bacterium]
MLLRFLTTVASRYESGKSNFEKLCKADGFANRAKRFKLMVLLPILCMLFVSETSFSQITGKAYRDYNGDGIQQGGEPNRGNIIVKFYTNGTLPAKDVLVGTTTTASNGTYSFNPPSYPVRIEFEIPDGFCNLSPTQDFSADNGDTYGTAVQFA